MTVARACFLAVFMLLTVGSIGIRSAVAPLFGGIGARGEPRLPTPPPTRTATAAHHRVAPTPKSRHANPRRRPHLVAPTPRPTARRRFVPRHRPPTTRPSSTATPVPTATAVPTPTSGTIALARYWVGSLQVRRGATIEVGYVIDNGTGAAQRLMLGASLKPVGALNWATSSVADPAHDVVAVVPPGVSTHVRYFTVAAGLRPGMYDVAWGLRDSSTGVRDALVFGPGTLRIAR